MSTSSSQHEQRNGQQRTRGSGRLGRVLFLAAAVSVLGIQSTAQGAVFNIPCGNTAALIAAITSANANGQNDTIILPACTYTLTKVHNNTQGPNGLPSITSQITIKGAGAASSIITRAPQAPPFRLVHVAPSGNLTLQGVGLTHGLLASGSGGGLLNAGKLTLIRSTVRDNGVFDLACGFCGTGPGGGISNDGTLTLLESTVSDNFSERGGGIANSGTMNLTKSTVTGNGADNESGAGVCGGIDTSGTATLASSTISGNNSSVLGGGICNSGTVALRHSTIVENGVADGTGGGIVNDGTFTMRNSIVAGNTSCSEGAPLGFCPVKDDCAEFAEMTTFGRNLLGSSCPSNRLVDIVVPAQQDFGNILGPLQNNGGPTLTHLPLPGSLPIDTGSFTCDATDQRGLPRPQDGNSDGTDRCDSGAVEFDPTAWNHYPFASQNKNFSVTFDAVPHMNFMNGLTGLARGPVNSVDDLAVIVRFNSPGRIDARNGGSYMADRTISYVAGTQYRFRLVVNVAQHTFSAFVKAAGGTEQTLATNYGFRNEQKAVPSLDTWFLKPFQGSHTATKFTLGFLSTLSWQHFLFLRPAGLPRAVNAAFAAIPHQNRMNGITGLALGPVNSDDDLAVIVRFNSAGRIDARNGNSYTADRAISYTAGVRHEFRLVVNIAQHTYSVYVKPEGGIEQTLATDYAFRTEQSTVAELNSWALRASQGSHTAEGFSVNVVPE